MATLCANFYISINTPIMSDSARDINIIAQIAESGEIGSTLPYWMGRPPK